MEIKVDIHGGRDIQNALRELPGRVAGKALRQALAFAGRPMRTEARHILKGRGYDRRTWTGPALRTQRNPTPFSARVSLGYKTSAAQLALLERGVRPHTVPSRGGPDKVLGYYRDDGSFVFFGKGQVEHKGFGPKPWLRPAFDSKKDEVLKLFGSEIWVRIQREAERLRRR